MVSLFNRITNSADDRPIPMLAARVYPTACGLRCKRTWLCCRANSSKNALVGSPEPSSTTMMQWRGFACRMTRLQAKFRIIEGVVNADHNVNCALGLKRQSCLSNCGVRGLTGPIGVQQIAAYRFLFFLQDRSMNNATGPPRVLPPPSWTEASDPRTTFSQTLWRPAHFDRGPQSPSLHDPQALGELPSRRRCSVYAQPCLRERFFQRISEKNEKFTTTFTRLTQATTELW